MAVRASYRHEHRVRLPSWRISSIVWAWIRTIINLSPNPIRNPRRPYSSTVSARSTLPQVFILGLEIIRQIRVVNGKIIIVASVWVMTILIKELTIHLASSNETLELLSGFANVVRYSLVTVKYHPHGSLGKLRYFQRLSQPYVFLFIFLFLLVNFTSILSTFLSTFLSYC